MESLARTIWAHVRQGEINALALLILAVNVAGILLTFVSGRPVSTPWEDEAVKHEAGRARMWTGGTSPGPPGDPSRRWRAAQTARVKSPPGGSAGAERHAPAAPAPPCG